MRDFIPFVQFKKREKHPWRSVTFTKVTYILKGHYAAAIYLRQVKLSFTFRGISKLLLGHCFTEAILSKKSVAAAI